MASGFPDANISWSLLNETGTLVASGSLTPTAGAVSVDVQISSANNSLGAGEVLGARELLWSYTVAAAAVSGSHRYTIEGSVPFVVSEAGVRQLIGIDQEDDLPDHDVPLIKAYLHFQNAVGDDALAAGLLGTAFERSQIATAIEAQAALMVLPSLQVRLAQKESSGTNQFARGKIDWERLEAHLARLVSEGSVIVNPATDPLATNNTALLVLVTPVDDLFPGG